MANSWQSYFPAGDWESQHYCVRLDEVSEALFRMGEAPLWPPPAHDLLTIRVTVIPRWSFARCVRVVEDGARCLLSGRSLDGEEAAYELGKLHREVDRVLTTDEARSVIHMWRHLRFESLAAVDPDDVDDDSSTVIEAVRAGRYHAVRRDRIDFGDTYGEFSELLQKLAGFDPPGPFEPD